MINKIKEPKTSRKVLIPPVRKKVQVRHRSYPSGKRDIAQQPTFYPNLLPPNPLILRHVPNKLKRFHVLCNHFSPINLPLPLLIPTIVNRSHLLNGLSIFLLFTFPNHLTVPYLIMSNTEATPTLSQISSFQFSVKKSQNGNEFHNINDMLEISENLRIRQQRLINFYDPSRSSNCSASSTFSSLHKNRRI